MHNKVMEKNEIIIANAFNQDFAFYVENIQGIIEIKKYCIHPVPEIIQNVIKIKLIWGLAVLKNDIYFLI